MFVDVLVWLQVINVEGSTVQMLPTKVEIKMKKTNGALWSNLEIPRPKPQPTEVKEKTPEPAEASLEDQVDAVDLSDL